MSVAVSAITADSKAEHRLSAVEPSKLLWALGIGLLAGAACVAIRFVFRWTQHLLVGRSGLLPDAATSLTPVHRALVPIIGAILATFVAKVGRWWFQRRQHSQRYEGYIEAVRFNGGRIALAPTAWSTASSVFSVASGAAIGREGSMIQFATALASGVGRLSKTRGLSLAKKVTCGIAASVAAAYQAPVAGVFFAYEIVLGEWDWVRLPQLVISSVTGWLIARVVLGSGPLFPTSEYVDMRSILWTLPLALCIAVLAPLSQKLMLGLRGLQELPCPLLWGGAVVGLLSIVEPKVWGNGDVALLDILQHHPTLSRAAVVLALRLCATGVTAGTGTIGGVFTPTLFAGASLGIIAAHLIHAPEPTLLAIAGLSVMLSSSTRAPWMAAFMAVELTGQWHLLLLLLPLNITASAVTARISSQTLYAVAEPTFEEGRPLLANE